MNKVLNFLRKNSVIIVILLLASCLRLIMLDEYPRGTYTDEAYGAYIANGILTEGIDDRGYHFPIYFVAWGSGMNALYLYLGVLFFKLFGVSLVVYRLPQAIFGIFGIAALYFACKELFDKRTALFFAFVLTVNPWHIMMCRFGLESNLAPNMFLIGLAFLVLGLRRASRYLIPSAVFMGLTLYCYALTWLILPLFFGLTIVFCWKWIPRRRESLLFVILLFLMALPLFLFLFVNYGLLPEIRTPFFSIPKLTGFRGGELFSAYLRNNLKVMLDILIFEQSDRQELLSSQFTGAYYFFTTPFMLFGVVVHICTLLRHFKRGKNDLSILFLIWFISAAIISILNERLSMIHINMLHIPIIFYGAYGMYRLAEFVKSRLLLPSCAVFYAVSLLIFVNSYIHMDFAHFFDEKPYEALLRAEEIAGKDMPITFYGYTIYKFPNLLWKDKINILEYSQNAVHDNDPFFIELLEYKNYRFISDASMDEVSADEVYVISAQRMWDFHARGFVVEQVNEQYAVASMQMPYPENVRE